MIHAVGNDSYFNARSIHAKIGAGGVCLMRVIAFTINIIFH